MDQVLLKDLFEEEDTHWWHTAKRNLIRDFLPGQGRVLVLGVGGGRLCSELAGTFDVTVTDISPEACKHAKEVYGLRTIQCDLEKGLPFDKEEFDVIIIADVLEHIRHDKDLITEMSRCMKKGGTLLLTVPAYAHMWSHWDERLNHFRRYEYRALKTLVVKGNFKIKKISFFNALIYPAALVRRKFIGVKENHPSDFKISQGGFLMNRLMGFYYAMERSWIHWGKVPFGLSLFVCAERS